MANLHNFNRTGAITTVKIANGAVDTIALQDRAVSALKIANGAVGARALASGAVTSQHLQPGAVSAGKLGYGAVTSDNIQEQSIDTQHIAPGPRITFLSTVDPISHSHCLHVQR